MPNIKPISDLRNYTEVLKETSEGAPVFLTKNGRGEYVILDMKDYDRMKAELALMAESGKGEKTVREEDWVSTPRVILDDTYFLILSSKKPRCLCTFIL